MSDTIDISVAISEDQVSISTTEVGIPEINAIPNVIEVNIINSTTINPLFYDLSEFTNTSSDPFVQVSDLGDYVPESRTITINGDTKDLSTDRSWTIPTDVHWGDITGAITDQTDLQLELDAKFDVPTGNTTQYLDGAGTPTTFPSLLSADKMVTVGRNATGSTLYKGTIVYISGSTGNRPNFVKAQANSEATSAGTFGVIEADIPNNSDGNCVTIGTIDNLDTRSTATHPFTTDTLVDGDTIYLSPTTAGYITNVKPYAPSHLVYVGKVVRTSPTNGTIVYRIQNGYELDELHDVAAQTPSNNEVLSFETSTQLWKPKSIPTLLGYTPVSTARTITINGTTQDLSSDRSWTISTGITIGTTAITSGTVGRVLFEGTGNVVSESANLFWDNTNGRLGIGTSSPESIMHLNDSVVPRLTISETGRIEKAYFQMIQGSVQYSSNAYYDNVNWQRNNTALPSWNLLITPDGNDRFAIRRTALGSGVITWTELMSIRSNGNVLINQTTDAGYKLDVNGNSRIYGTLQVTGNFNASGTFDIFKLGGQLIVRTTDTTPMAFQISYIVKQLIHSTGVLIGGGVTAPTGTTAALEVQSTTQGFLPPRGTNTQMLAISTPAAGLMFIDNTTSTNNILNLYNGTGWGSVLTSNPTVTASAALGRGFNYTPSLTAAANNDVLVGLDINPTFTNGAFTLTRNIGLRVQAGRVVIGSPSNDVSDYPASLLVASNYTLYGATPQHGGLWVTESNSGNFANIRFYSNGTPTFLLGRTGTTYGGMANKSFMHSSSDIWFTASSSGYPDSTGHIMVMFQSTRNIGINTTTDAGYKLDVNGTARVSNKLSVYSGASMSLTSNYAMEVGFNANGKIAFGYDVSSGSIIQAVFGTSAVDLFMQPFGGSLMIGANSAPNSSARVQIDSTTKGFLPPRMDTTQRDAIVTPATGLQIYNTTTNTNDTYNGTAWVSGVSGSISSASGNLFNYYNFT